MLSLGLASFLVCNSIADIGVVFADEISSRTTISIGQVGNKLSYIGDRHGNTLKFPRKEVKGMGQEAFCLEHNKSTPSSSGMTYTEGGTLDSGLAYIMSYKPNTGNSDKDYYIKQTAIHYYLGQINWIQYATTGTDLRDKAVALANEAKSREVKSSVSITASPRQQDFRLVGDNYETDWFNVSIQGNLTAYRMDIKGAPNGTQIINANGNVVKSLTQNDTKFKLRVPKSSVNGNYEIKILLSGEFISDKAIEYIPTSSSYQKIGILKKYPTNAQDYDVIKANLTGTGEVEVTKKSENGSVLSGAGFKLVKDGQDATSVKETGADGRVIFSDLVPGTYEVVETKAPIGHVINPNRQTVTVTAGNTSRVEVSNEIIKGRVKVLKVDEETGQPLKGAEFDLKDRATGQVVEKLVTGEDGAATSGLYPLKEYVLQETKAPEKYTLNGQEYFVTISEHMQTIEVTAKNRIIKGQIAVNKSDSEIDGLNLQGVEFEISNEDGQVVDTLITDENGYAISKVLNYGKYFLKETKTLSTHILSDKVYEVNITEDGKVYTYDIKNDAIKGKIQIVKVDKENEEVPVEGAIFNVISEDVFGVAQGTIVDTITSDKDGFAYTKDLRAGRYKIVETFAPEGYWQSDKEYFVDVTEHGKVYVRYISNEPIQAKLRVIKTDGKEKYPLADAKFKIVNKATGEDVEFKEFIGIIPIKKTVFTTDKNGEFITPQNLKYGEYQLVEVEAPEGYNLAEPIDFNIDANTSMEDIELLGTIATKEVINTRITGNMELLKVDEDTNEPLEGVEFKVTCLDGFMKNQTWDLVSNKDGKVSLENIEYGKYRIEEVKTIEGYVLNTTPIEFEIKENGQTIKLEMTNRMIRGKVEISKIDSEKLFDLPLAGAEFTIYDKDGNEVDKLVTNIFGKAKSKDLLYGKYTMKETKAPQGYLLNETVYEINIKTDGQVVTFDIENNIKKGKVEIIKLDSELKEDLPLADAEFTIYDLNRNEVDKLVTDINGYAISKDIRYGRYIMQETKAPQGYLLNETIYEIEVLEDGKIYSYTIENTIKKGRVEIHKTDSETGRVLKDAEFTIYDLNRNEVDKLVTDENGYAISEELRAGRYIMQETKAPQHYLLNETIYEIEVLEDGKVYTYDITNDVEKGDLEFSKTDVATGEIVEGAAIEITGLDETNNHIKFDFISSKDDKFKLPVGEYEFKETIAPNGYVLNEEVGRFEIKENGEIVKAELKNKRIEGILDFSKTDVSTGDVIDGAHIKIECLEGFDKGKVIEFVSSKDGNRFPLLYGKYQITETIAPEGYVKTDEVGTFEIKEDGQIVKAELKNQRMIIKTDNPKTGDVSIVGISILAVSALSGLLYINLKNRKDEE